MDSEPPRSLLTQAEEEELALRSIRSELAVALEALSQDAVCLGYARGKLQQALTDLHGLMARRLYGPTGCDLAGTIRCGKDPLCLAAQRTRDDLASA